MQGKRILIIEDEPAMVRFLRTTLHGQECILFTAASGRAGLVTAASCRPDLVLLDLGLPDMDGLAVLAELRGWSQAPVIILSARGQEDDKVRGLDSGADDYLTKPFATGELLARMRACLRRSGGESEADAPVFVTGELRVDLARRQVFVRGNEVHLTPIEYKLLTEFVHHAGKVLTHHHLLKAVWNSNNDDQMHYVRIFVHQLRQKIDWDSARPEYLLSEPGVGYRLKYPEK